MLQELVAQAKQLPGEIESLAKEVAQLKNSLHELALLKEVKEASIAGKVANEKADDGRARFPNEQARQAEITRRLLEDEEWKQLKADLDETRQALAQSEAALEKARAEHRTALALLEVVASALRGGMALQEVEALLASPQTNNASKAPEKAPQNGSQEQDTTRQAIVKVLEARPGKSEGTIRAWCETEDGDRVAVFAKNSTAKKLASAVGKKVRIEFKELDAGWFAIKVA